MAGFWNKSRSLKQLVLLSWFAPAALTLIASLTVFFFLGWLDYKNNTDMTTADLREKSKMAARRISAELLLEEHGVVDSVLTKLQDDLEISGLELTISPGCSVENETCVKIDAGKVLVLRQIPQVNSQQYVVLAQQKRPLISFLNLKFLAWSTLPVFFLIVIGLVIQLIFLRRKVMIPVNSLVDAAEAAFVVRDNWPTELKQIGGQLKASFEAKEQAVFSLLAKGVIHDIKTFMHSLLIATDMIGESTDENKRVRRLENLYNASKTNLPKIKRIIELTLDGSHEIPIHGINTSLIETIESAIATNSSYAKENNVYVRFKPADELIVAHDPVQLERAIANLIRNGIEVFSTRKIDSVAFKEVCITVDNQNSQTVRVNVEDSGPGYSGDANHFKPVKSKKVHGAGLGLYVTQKIIQGHHGKLNVTHSPFLGGARFCISLPKGGVSL